MDELKQHTKRVRKCFENYTFIALCNLHSLRIIVSESEVSILTMKKLAEFLAILNKLEIQSNPMLKDAEKELYKQVVDEIKKQIR